MSLILDALNRADRERSEENNQINLHASQSPSTQHTSPVRRWIIEGVIIVLAIAAFAYSQWKPTSDTPQSATVKTDRESSAPIKTAPIKQETMTQAVIETTEQAEPNTSQSSVTNTEKVIDKPTNHKAIASLYKTQSEIKEKTIQKPAQTKAKPETQPTPKPVVKPEPPIDNTQFILQQIPLITQMPSRFQRTVPSINYEVHMYAEGGKGFVTINGSVLKTGAVIDPGLRVIAILEDSVVLEFNNQQFRLPALNSWVNYN